MHVNYGWATSDVPEFGQVNRQVGFWIAVDASCTRTSLMNCCSRWQHCDHVSVFQMIYPVHTLKNQDGCIFVQHICNMLRDVGAAQCVVLPLKWSMLRWRVQCLQFTRGFTWYSRQVPKLGESPSLRVK